MSESSAQNDDEYGHPRPRGNEKKCADSLSYCHSCATMTVCDCVVRTCNKGEPWPVRSQWRWVIQCRYIKYGTTFSDTAPVNMTFLLEGATTLHLFFMNEQTGEQIERLPWYCDGQVTPVTRKAMQKHEISALLSRGHCPSNPCKSLPDCRSHRRGRSPKCNSHPCWTKWVDYLHQPDTHAAACDNNLWHTCEHDLDGTIPREHFGKIANGEEIGTG